MGLSPEHDGLVRILGSGSYTRIAEKTGLSRSHVGRVLRGESRLTENVEARISRATGVGREELREYIKNGGSPSTSHVALWEEVQNAPVIECPREEGGPKWDPLREVILGLKPGDEVNEESAVLVRMDSPMEARSAVESLHSGRRNEGNLLRNVEMTTRVRGRDLLIWRKG